MRKNQAWIHFVMLTTLLATMLTGCGGSSVSDAPPPPAQTGDTTLFTNASLLSTATTLDTAGVVILDARSATEYNAGHIPGALSAPPEMFTVTGKDNVLLPVAELETKLGAMGITRTSKIVIYDNTTESLGAGGRLFWMLEYLGCTAVSLLNGGWDQWVVQGRLTDTEIPVPSPATFTAIDPLLAINVTKEDITSHPGYAVLPLVIVDARTFDEYRGFDINNLPVLIETTRAGHIPGAINLPYKTCYNADKTVLNYNDLKLLFESRGITKDKYVIVYSTVGKRSAFIYYLTRLMGYTSVANYCGSAVDWSSADESAYPLVLGPTP